MAITKTSKDLTPSQNELLTTMRASVTAQFRGSGNVSFASDNNKFKFAASFYGSVGSVLRTLGSPTSGKTTRNVVADALINLRINNNKVSINSAMKLAFVNMMYSDESVAYARAEAASHARIDLLFSSLSSGQRDTLKSSMSLSLQATFSAIAAKQSADIIAWANARASLNFSATNSVVAAERVNMLPEAGDALRAAIMVEHTTQGQARLDYYETMPAILGPNANSEMTSIIAKPIEGMGLTSSIPGSSTGEIDKNFNEKVKQVVIPREAMEPIIGDIELMAGDWTPPPDMPAITRNKATEDLIITGMREFSVTPKIELLDDPEDGIYCEPVIIVTSLKEGPPIGDVPDWSFEPPGSNNIVPFPTGTDLVDVQPEPPSRVRFSTDAQLPSMPVSEKAWVLEWRPRIQVGIVKIPYEKFVEARGQGDMQYVDVIRTTAPDDGETWMGLDPMSDPYSSFVLFLNSSNLAMLQDARLSRKLITNTVVTQGTKYYQAFTENFPDINLKMQVIKFGGISQRVLNFLDAVITFSSNPRKYPGDFYVYDVFAEDLLDFDSRMARYYRKYKVLPSAFSKNVNARDNTLIDITLTGTVVEWYQRQ